MGRPGMKISELLYPSRCFACGEISGELKDCLCPACDIKLAKSSGMPYIKKGEYFIVSVSPFLYRGSICSSLKKFKFAGKYSYAGGYAAHMKKALDIYGTDFDLITWIPVSFARKYKRGYDQCELIAHELAALYGKKEIKTLAKIRNNKTQSSLETSKRKTNVMGVYRLKRRAADIVKDARILLVDDIITTGSTMSEASRILLLGGAENVTAVTAAKA